MRNSLMTLLPGLHARQQTMRPALMLSLCLLGAPGAAWAGWFEVTNYTGTIGQSAVHISLQSSDSRDPKKPHERPLEGSYYYDAHRVPIALDGKRQPDGRIVLCEATEPDPSYSGSFKVPKPSAKRPITCPITLQPANGGLAGEWNDGTHKLPVVLQQVGRLDDRGDVPIVEGRVEIPMWVHTRNDLVLGVYRSATDCPVSMLELRLVNKRSGQVDRSIPLRCDAGMIMTTIYMNVSAGSKEGKLTVGYQGGRMGFDEEVDVRPRPARK